MSTYPAFKCFTFHLYQANLTSSNLFKYNNTTFNTVWMEGIVISYQVGPTQIYYLDDSTGLTLLSLIHLPTNNLTPGDYITVMGPLIWSAPQNVFIITATKIINKNHDPNAECIWGLEVVGVHREVYLPQKELEIQLGRQKEIQSQDLIVIE